MCENCILAVGSIAIDYLEMPDGRKGEVIGGSATYFTLSASPFAPVHVVGIVGSDFPEEGLDLLQQHAANLDDLQIVEGKTFRWGGRYHGDWEHRSTLFTELGVFESFKPILSPASRHCRYLFLGNIQPSLQHDVLDQVQNPGAVICDTMNLWIQTAKKGLEAVLERTDVLLLNDSEATLLSGRSDPFEAANEIRKKGPGTVVVKRGRQGAILANETGEVHVDVFPVSKVVDPTGAGDSYAGGLVGALAKGEPIAEAVITASAVASFCVEGFGVEKLKKLALSDIHCRKEVIRERSNLP